MIQRVGRIARALPGKADSILLDHAGNTHVHGLFETERRWTLDGDGQGKPAGDDDDYVRLCPACFCQYSPRLKACPECGAVHIPKKKKIEVASGELKELIPERWYKCTVCYYRGRLPEGAAYDTTPCGRCQAGPLQALASKYDSGTDADGRRKRYIEWFREGQARNYKPTWAALRFKTTYNHWPPRQWQAEAERV
jgi:hypothetical protein